MPTEIDAWFPPELAERYRSERVLGRGGMGVVALARDLQLGRRVAIKLLPPESFRLGLAERLVREARALAKLSSPHVVHIFDAGTAGSHPYLVMEHLEGSSLTEILGKGLLDDGQLAEMMEHILEGLATAHEADLLHRDVKPSNVLRLDTGRWVLIDFGLAWHSQESGHLTAPGAVVGTVFFLAPELVTGGEPSPRSDLFSAALTGFAAWTGSSPLGDTVIRQADAVRALSSLASGAYYEEAMRRLRGRGKLGDLLAKALAPEPHLRFASAREMLEQLRARAEAPAARPTMVGLNPPTQPDTPVLAGAPAARGAVAPIREALRLEPARANAVVASLRRRALPAALAIFALAGAFAWQAARRPDARPAAAPRAVVPASAAADMLPAGGPPAGPLGATGPSLQGFGRPDARPPRISVEAAAGVLVRADPGLWVRDAVLRAPGVPLARVAKAVQRGLPSHELDALGAGPVDLAAIARGPLHARVYDQLFARFALELMAGLTRLEDSTVLGRFPPELKPGVARPPGRSFRVDLGKHTGLSTGRLIDWFVMERSERRSLPGDNRWKAELDGLDKARAAWLGLHTTGLPTSAFVTLTINGRLKIDLAPTPGSPAGWMSHTLPEWALFDGENVFDAHLYSRVGARDARIDRLFEFVVVLTP